MDKQEQFEICLIDDNKEDDQSELQDIQDQGDLSEWEEQWLDKCLEEAEEESRAQNVAESVPSNLLPAIQAL